MVLIFLYFVKYDQFFLTQVKRSVIINDKYGIWVGSQVSEQLKKYLKLFFNVNPLFCATDFYNTKENNGINHILERVLEIF